MRAPPTITRIDRGQNGPEREAQAHAVVPARGAPEAVAAAPHRLDDGAVHVLELVPQVPHVDVDHVAPGSKS